MNNLILITICAVVFIIIMFSIMYLINELRQMLKFKYWNRAIEHTHRLSNWLINTLTPIDIYLYEKLNIKYRDNWTNLWEIYEKHKTLMERNIKFQIHKWTYKQFFKEMFIEQRHYCEYTHPVIDLLYNSKRVGIDLHGTIDNDVRKSKCLLSIMRMLMDAGVEVWIISGGPDKKHIKESLEDLEVYENTHYTQIVCVVDFLKRHGVRFTYDSVGNPWCNNLIWWHSKADIMNKYKIDFLIDDKESYGNHLEPGRFLHYPSIINRIESDFYNLSFITGIKGVICK